MPRNRHSHCPTTLYPGPGASLSCDVFTTSAYGIPSGGSLFPSTASPQSPLPGVCPVTGTARIIAPLAKKHTFQLLLLLLKRCVHIHNCRFGLHGAGNVALHQFGHACFPPAPDQSQTELGASHFMSGEVLKLQPAAVWAPHGTPAAPQPVTDSPSQVPR